MPLDYIGSLVREGTDFTPLWNQVKLIGPPLIGATLLKLYANGSSNTWERKLHGKVYIVTGGTSGIGAALVRTLASNGAQLVLLTSQIGEESDNSAKLWMTDYIEDLREATGNELIYAEYCDLSSLYSIRKFATKWLDNSPARRLDGVLCLASESLPLNKLRTNSVDGVEIQMAVNYLGHFHLLTLLEPALRVQPADRDVRVLVSSCLTQNLGQIELTDLLWEDRTYPSKKPWTVYGTSKLLLNMFAKEFQRRVESVERPDKQPCGVRINIVNPGMVRSPGTRRYISMGTFWGLLAYLVFYPVFWLFLKSCQQGTQSYLYALNSPNVFNIKGGQYIKECSVVAHESRSELNDDFLQKKIYELTQDKIAKLEKLAAIERNKGKKSKKTDAAAPTATARPAPGPVGSNRTDLTDESKISLFKSAFADPHEPSLYPDMSKNGLHSNDAKDRRLQRLDAKWEQTRKAEKPPQHS